MAQLRAKQYQQAYFWLYRVTTAVSSYTQEALYLCGMIAWQNLRDYNSAVQFFRKAAETGQAGDRFTEQSIVMLSLMYAEAGRRDEAMALMTTRQTNPRSG
jgi:tetratricopeptide (TPR) repeat protein